MGIAFSSYFHGICLPILQCLKGKPPSQCNQLVAVLKGTGETTSTRIGSAFNHARTITKASAKKLDARKYNFNKGLCSPGILVNNKVR